MSSRKLRVLETKVATRSVKIDEQPAEVSVVEIIFSRKLNRLEVSGVCAVLEGEIK